MYNKSFLIRMPQKVILSIVGVFFSVCCYSQSYIVFSKGSGEDRKQEISFAVKSESNACLAKDTYFKDGKNAVNIPFLYTDPSVNYFMDIRRTKIMDDFLDEVDRKDSEGRLYYSKDSQQELRHKIYEDLNLREVSRILGEFGSDVDNRKLLKNYTDKDISVLYGYKGKVEAGAKVEDVRSESVKKHLNDIEKQPYERWYKNAKREFEYFYR